MKLQEVKYNNKLDEGGWEINLDELIEDCIIWLTGSSGPAEFKDQSVFFQCRLKLFGSKKNTILRYDVPETIENSKDAFKWGVDQVLDNVRNTLDRTLNELFEDNETEKKI